MLFFFFSLSAEIQRPRHISAFTVVDSSSYTGRTAMSSSNIYEISNTIYTDIHNTENGGGAILYTSGGATNVAIELTNVQFNYVTADDSSYATGGALVANMGTGSTISMNSVCGYMCKATKSGMFAYMGAADPGAAIAEQLSLTCCGWEDKASAYSAIEIPSARMTFVNLNISSCQNGPLTDSGSKGAIIADTYGFEVDITSATFINNTGYSLFYIDGNDGYPCIFDQVNIYNNKAEYAIFDQRYSTSDLSNCFIYKNVGASNTLIKLKQGAKAVNVRDTLTDADMTGATIISGVDTSAPETLGDFGTVEDLCRGPVGPPPVVLTETNQFTSTNSFTATSQFSSSSQFSPSSKFTESSKFSQSTTFTPTPSVSPPSPSFSPSPTASQSPTSTASESPSHSPLPTPTESPSASASQSPTSSPLPTASQSPTATASQSPTETPSKSPTATASQSPLPTLTPTASVSPAPTKTPSPSYSPSESNPPTPTKEPHSDTFTPSRTNEFDENYLVRASVKNEFGNLSSGQVAGIATGISLTLIIVSVVLMIVYIYYRRNQLKERKSESFSTSDSSIETSSSELSYSYEYESYSYSELSYLKSPLELDPFYILSSDGDMLLSK